MLAEAAQEASLDILLAQEVVDTETFTQKLSEAGYPHISYSAAFQNKNVIFYLAMASKTPLVSPDLYMTHASASYIMVKQTVLAGQNLNLFTAHLAHGFHNELERVRALELDFLLLFPDVTHEGTLLSKNPNDGTMASQSSGEVNNYLSLFSGKKSVNGWEVMAVQEVYSPGCLCTFLVFL